MPACADVYWTSSRDVSDYADFSDEKNWTGNPTGQNVFFGTTVAPGLANAKAALLTKDMTLGDVHIANEVGATAYLAVSDGNISANGLYIGPGSTTLNFVGNTISATNSMETSGALTISSDLTNNLISVTGNATFSGSIDLSKFARSYSPAYGATDTFRVISVEGNVTNNDVSVTAPTGWTFSINTEGESKGLTLTVNTESYYYWTGTASDTYTNVANWNVGGVVATQAPTQSDIVMVQSGSAKLPLSSWLSKSYADVLSIGGGSTTASVIMDNTAAVDFNYINEIRVFENGSLLLTVPTATGGQDFRLHSNLYVDGGTVEPNGNISNSNNKTSTIRLLGNNNVIEEGSIKLFRMSLGYKDTQHVSSMIQNGGTIEVGYFPVGFDSEGVFVINDGTVNVGVMGGLSKDKVKWEIGNSAKGTVFINGGKVNVRNNAADYYGILSVGTSALFAQVTQTAGDVHCGEVIYGTNVNDYYRISGGTLLVERSIALKSATSFQMDGGTVTTGSMTIASGVSGITEINGGRLVITGGVLPTFNIGGAANSTAVLDFNAGTYAYVLSGGISLEKTGEGTVILSGANTHTGTTTVSGGTLSLETINAIGNSSSVINNSAITFTASQKLNNLTGAGNLTGSTSGSTITLNNTADTVFSGSFTGVGVNLTKMGENSITLSGAINHTGATTVSEGTLVLPNANALSASSGVTNNATIQTTGEQRFNNLQGTNSNAEITGTGAITLDNTLDTSYAGKINNQGDSVVSVVKTGDNTLTLSGASAYSGGTTLSGGKTIVASSSVVNGSNVITSGPLGTGDVTIASSTSLLAAGSGTQTLHNNIVLNSSLSVDTTQNLNLNGGISGTSSLNKSGTGTLTLSGANTYSGDTTVTGGTLALTASSIFHTDNTTVLSSPMGTGNLTVSTGAGLAFNRTSLEENYLAINGIADFNECTIDVSNYLSGVDISSQRTITVFTASSIAAGSTPAFYGAPTNWNYTISGNSIVLNYAVAGDWTWKTDRIGTFATKDNWLIEQTPTPNSDVKILSGVSTVDASIAVKSVRLDNKNNLVITPGADILLSAQTMTIDNVTAEGYDLNGGRLLLLNAPTFNITNTSATPAGFGIDNPNAQTYANSLSGKMNFVKTGTGDLTLTGENSYTGTTRVLGGKLILNVVNAIDNSSAVTNDAIIQLGANQTLNNLTGTELAAEVLGTNAYSLTLNNTTDTTYAGVLSGAINVNKTGAAQLTLSNNSSDYTGMLTVSEGTLNLSIADAISNAASVTNNAAITYGSNVQELDNLSGTSAAASITGSAALTLNNTQSTQYAGSINGTGVNVRKTGAGELELSGNNGFTGALAVAAGTLSLSGTNVYTGPTTVTGGTLNLETENAIVNSASIVNNAAITFGANNQQFNNLSGSGTITGAAALTLNNSAPTTFSGKINGIGTSLEKIGTGTITLTGQNTYTGATTVTEGVLNMESENVIASSSSVVNNAAIAYDGDNQVFKNLSGNTATATITGTAALTLENNTATEYAGSINGNGARIEKTGMGTLTLSGANTYTGQTTVTDGTLNLTAAQSVANSSGVTNNAAIVYTGTQKFNNLSGNTAASTITGSGNLELANDTDSSYIGLFSLDSSQVTKTGAGILTLDSPNSDTRSTMESVAVNSGAMNMAGFYQTSVTVLGNAEFSPGETIGTADLNGNFLLNSAAILTLDIGKLDGGVFAADKLLTEGNITLDAASVINLAYDGTNPGVSASYDLLQTTGTGNSIIGWDLFDWTNLITAAGFDLNNWEIIASDTSVKLNYTAPEILVPEPSTWTLLLLGALGLLWLRRKSR